MKFGNTFVSDIKNNYSKYSSIINSFIKENLWITPLVYAIGTVLLLIRNKTYGLQFSAISIGQLFLMTIYVLLMFVMYGYIKFIIKSIFQLVKSDVKSRKICIAKYVVIYVILIFITLYVLSLLMGDFIKGLKFVGIYFVIYPVVMLILKNEGTLSNIITFVIFSIIIMNIPISLGGFCGQNVIYHDYNTGDSKEYTYYGNYDGLYQFVKNEKVILIPIEGGYIEYSR